MFYTGSLILRRVRPGSEADAAGVRKFAGCAIGAMNGRKVRTRKGLTRVCNSIPSGVQAVIRFRRKWNNHPGGTFEDWWPEWHPYPHLKNQKPE